MAAKGGRSYLVHEYVNEWWQPQFHMDVVRDLAAAKLDFAGSAVLLDNFPTLAMDERQRRLWEAIPAPELQETLRDYFVPRMLRKDVFVRGARRLTVQRQEDLLREIPLVAIALRGEIKTKIATAGGAVELEPAVYGPMLDALSEGPRTVGELMDLPGVKGRSRASAVEVVSLLTAGGQVMPGLPGCPGSNPAALSINAETIAKAGAARMAAQHPVAAPLLGSGLHLPTLDCLCLGAPGDGQVVETCLRKAAESGEALLDDGQPVSDPDLLKARLTAEVSLAAARVPLLSRCGIA
jgi:hypothetical protein